MVIHIFPNKTEYVLGEEVEARIDIELEKPVKARGVFATLFCTEKNNETERIIFKKQEKISGEKNYHNEGYVAKILLPKNGKPSNALDGSMGIIWKLHVKLDIPFAADINKERKIIVKAAL